MDKKVLVIEDEEKFIDCWMLGKHEWAKILKRHSPGNLLASFEAEVGSVFGHYTGDPKGNQVELKIVAIPDGLEGERIEKGKEYHILILEVKNGS